ncbi:hypothetical protein AB0C27_17785 [Nonomuraea sp. NPDC048882]|uniref:hypothetical protein n=1 Tax=Nonomuraea sp. NPDC048882 TaxID=3154347 RepID=UPI003403C8BE
MDELIRELYGTPREDPRARHRVWRKVAARRRRGRLTWLAIPATVALTAILLTVLPAGDPPPAPGRSILLTAAASAASATSSGSGGSGGSGGAYWHVRKQRDGGPETELWVNAQGRAWTFERGRVSRVTGRSPFSVGGRGMTYEQIQALPAEAGALRDHVAAMLPGGSRALLADALSGLLWTKPSAPGVRAAAYRALADLPEVHYLGAATDPRGRGGQAFAYALPSGVRRTLIIDPASSQVLSSADSGQGGRSELILTAGWTDQGPPNLP